MITVLVEFRGVSYVYGGRLAIVIRSTENHLYRSGAGK